MKKNLLKSIIVAVLTILGTGSASALSANLTMEYELSGYKAKALYDLTSNDAGIMPESGDLRFRSGGWGLFDFGSGNRAAEVQIPVVATDVLVCQFADTQGRNVTINSISGCTKSSTLSDADGHLFFVADQDASSLTINIGRGGCVVSILVMEVDNEVKTADFTVRSVNIADGSDIREPYVLNGVVGSVAAINKSDYKNEDTGIKYIYVSDDTESNPIAEDGSTVVTITYREADYFYYVIETNVGTFVGEGDEIEGEEVSVPYGKYVIGEDGKLYTRAAGATTQNEFNYKFKITEPSTSIVINYNEDERTPVFFAEAETIEGMTETTASNANIRCSMSAGGYVEGEEPVAIVTLAPGTYTIESQVWGNVGPTLFINCGDNVLEMETKGYIQSYSTEEFTLEENTTVYATGGDRNHPFDYILITGSGSVAEDVPTAITGIVDKSVEHGAVYNLAGQKVNAANKGIYVVNGKKVVVK